MDNLKKIRANKKITQKTMSKMIGISLVHYSRIENKKRGLTVKNAKKIAKILNFDWTILFEEVKNENNKS